MKNFNWKLNRINGLMEENKTVPTTLRTDALFKEISRGKTMSKEERLNFINFMFEHIQTLEKGSRNKIAKEITRMYKEEHPGLKLNEMWVYRLLLAGIYVEKGKYGFAHIDCSVEDICSIPSMLEKALENKK